MQRVNFGRGCAFLCFVTFALVSRSVGMAQTLPLAMKDDPRLDRVVSVRVVGIETSALLLKLSDNKIFLRADRACAAQKLQIKLTKRPLRVLMQSLADLLPGAWEADKEKSGYTLVMDAQAVKRRARWQRLYQEAQAIALREHKQATLKAMQSEPAPLNGKESNPEIAANAVTAQTDHAFYQALPNALQEQISDALDDRLSVGSLSGSAASISRLSEDAIHVRLSELPDAAQKMLRARFQSTATLGSALTADPIIYFQNTGDGINLVIPDDEGMMRTDRNLPELSESYVVAPGMALEDTYAWAVEKQGAKSPHCWIELADFQRSRVWSNALAPPSTTFHFPPQNRPDALQWIADKADIEFVADYYARPSKFLTEGERKRELQKPLTAEFNALAGDQDLSWKQAANQIYLFRSNRWYRDDLTEAPGELLTEWVARLQKEAAQNKANPPTDAERWKAQMDFDAEVFAKLNLLQITRGLTGYTVEANLANPSGVPERKLVFLFGQMAPRLLRESKLLSFYEELTEGQRLALASGALAAASLSPTQQQKFVRAAPELASQISAALPLIGLKPQSAHFHMDSVSPEGALDKRPDLTAILLPLPTEK